MRTLSIGLIAVTQIKIYQDIDEMPVDQYNFFNEYSLRDAEIGNDMAAIYTKYSLLVTLIQSKNNDKALAEMNNLYQAHWNMINKINHKSLCFGCLIHSIDGVPLTDFSFDNLTKLISDLSRSGLTMKMVEEEVQGLKKKLLPSLS